MVNMVDKISIVVPIYKVEKYLARCIKSLLNQTYTNLEIILVDDGSPDLCPQMCEEYAQIDPRIIVIHKKNGGLSSARNIGIKRATGTYIGFVDSDDYVDHNMFALLYESIKRNNADISICGHYTEKGNRLTIEEPPIDNEVIYSSQEALKLLLEDIQIKNYAWDKLYRIDLFNDVYYPNGRNYEDIAVTYLVFSRAKSICIIPEYLYFYQMRDDSISNNVSKEKWLKNCADIVRSMTERYKFFEETNNRELSEKALVTIIPYILTLCNLNYVLSQKLFLEDSRKFLICNKKKISNSKLICSKDKKVVYIYTLPESICKMYSYISSTKLKRMVKKYCYKLHSKFSYTSFLKYPLTVGKKVRVFIFELPCFDNLGDHAIANAERVFFEDLLVEYGDMQLYQISCTETVDAIKCIKSDLRKSDVFVCQGGGNMGNLYKFGESNRRSIMKAFPNNTIIIFPQTFYFTNDKYGIRELAKSKRIYNKCSKLTIMARDNKSLQMMKQHFKCTVMPMVDIVTYLDKSKLVVNNRMGVILCLRSDLESNLSAKDKKYLYNLCQEKFDNCLVTDTVVKRDISENERIAILEEKWKLFASTQLVITDRLHGMIFSLITATPCIVIGNNQHKVFETYKTLRKCEYLWFSNSLEEVSSLIDNVAYTNSEYEKTSFDDQFTKLKKYILDLI